MSDDITVPLFNLLESKPFKTLRKLLYFEKNQLLHVLFMRLPNLHTSPKRHVIKIKTFLKKKIILSRQNTISRGVLKHSSKFLEISNDKT